MRETGAQNWDAFWRQSATGGAPSWSKRRICAILSRYAKPGMGVLDAGSGSGFFSKWFLSQGCEVHSLDYSQAALEATRAATGGKCAGYHGFDLTDPKAVSGHAGRFGLIFSDGLFEHFPEDTQRAIFTNMATMLNDGGVIVTFVPNRWTPWTLIRPFLMPGIHEKPFTRPSLERLYADAGFAVDESGGVNVWPAPLSPDALFGGCCGMLVYCVGRKRKGG
ncbi:MAG: class I SAM-dependent methyltransferase [Nitrospinae bacterium]|nr:class I SAM-dependent methyltransferase [Nitrospinota bacterium]